MAQKVKSLLLQSGAPKPILGTHMKVEGENQLHQVTGRTVLSSLLHTVILADAHLLGSVLWLIYYPYVPATLP